MTQEEAIKRIKGWNLDDDDMEVLSTLIPELKENEDEKIRKGLIQHLGILRGWTPGDPSPIKVKEHYDAWISWLEKQGHGGKKWIYEDVYFKEKERVFQDGIDEVLENPQKYGLEKQDEQPNKVSIWKHWNNGIAGNSDGVPIYLIKNGTTYRLSSCLGFECDYIELSELDKLMVEKQGEQKPAWSEEDDRIKYAICDTLDRIDEHIMKYNRQLTHQQVKDWLKSLKERM